MNLLIGNTYTLKYTHEFSHACGEDGFVDFSSGLNDEDRISALYVGCFNIGYNDEPRNIFINLGDTKRKYISFGIDSLDYIV